MYKNRDDILVQLKEENPEIFNDNEVIYLKNISSELQYLDELDKIFITRSVIFEKTGNIYGRKAKLIKLLNRLYNF
jgi:hypothetical protein